jgi:hypothetical protein
MMMSLGVGDRSIREKARLPMTPQILNRMCSLGSRNDACLPLHLARGLAARPRVRLRHRWG